MVKKIRQGAKIGEQKMPKSHLDGMCIETLKNPKLHLENVSLSNSSPEITFKFNIFLIIILTRLQHFIMGFDLLGLKPEIVAEHSISPIFVAIKTKMKSELGTLWWWCMGSEKNLCTIIIIANGHLEEYSSAL